jgi:hypothetical protein
MFVGGYTRAGRMFVGRYTHMFVGSYTPGWRSESWGCPLPAPYYIYICIYIYIYIYIYGGGNRGEEVYTGQWLGLRGGGVLWILCLGVALGQTRRRHTLYLICKGISWVFECVLYRTCSR